LANSNPFLDLQVFNRLKILFGIFVTLLCLKGIDLQAQLLKDTASLELVKKGIDDIYNFQFKDADAIFSRIDKTYPGHPVGYLLRGLKIYWENFPFLSTSPARASYESTLRKCIEICEKKHRTGDDADYLLADLCARGMLLVFYTDNELNRDVFPMAKSTYLHIRRCFDYTSVYPDFSYFTGIYDYYREAYPDAHPIYKPLAMLFPKGDKKRGIMELQRAGKGSIVLKAEAFSFLSYILLSFENNYEQATYYSKTLHDLYPENLEYIGEYIKNLLLLKNYDEAEELIRSSGTKTDNAYFHAQLTIFEGILKEKKYHDNVEAMELYLRGLKEISRYGKYGNATTAYAYYGLSRISDANGDKHNKKTYRRMANEMTDLKKVNFD
jgi:hypothetical protein